MIAGLVDNLQISFHSICSDFTMVGKKTYIFANCHRRHYHDNKIIFFVVFIVIIITITIMTTMKERERSVFYEGDGFMLGFNPYLAPGENQVFVFLGACIKEVLSFENSLEI